MARGNHDQELIQDLELLADFYNHCHEFRYTRFYSKLTLSRSDQELGDIAWKEAIEHAIEIVKNWQRMESIRQLNPAYDSVETQQKQQQEREQKQKQQEE